MKFWYAVMVSFLAAATFVTVATAQTALPQPQPSPKAVVSQTVGITDITISYHRPGVKGREIWGKLVPYNTVWRAGANENTTIAFGDPVSVEGHPLPAGTYGLHMIPAEHEWTIIFSRNATSWGSFFYDEKEDVLRVRVKPRPADAQESLSYDFSDLSDSSATVTLRWERLAVPFTVSLETPAIVVAHAREEYLRGLAGFTWQGFNQAAAYCQQHNVNTQEALAWVDKSISMNENFNNLHVKAGLMELAGKTSEAKTADDKAFSLATENDLNNYGYQLLGASKVRDAILIFRRNVQAHPESWNVYDSLGEAYDKNGNAKLAIECYTRASKLVKDDANRKRISEILKRLGTS